MQRDSSTYCDEPEDTADFAAFKNSFELAAKKADIEELLKVCAACGRRAWRTRTIYDWAGQTNHNHTARMPDPRPPPLIPAWAQIARVVRHKGRDNLSAMPLAPIASLGIFCLCKSPDVQGLPICHMSLTHTVSQHLIPQSNAFMSELQNRIVPLIVEHDVFWTRYFYRLAKLQVRGPVARRPLNPFPDVCFPPPGEARKASGARRTGKSPRRRGGSWLG